MQKRKSMDERAESSAKRTKLVTREKKDRPRKKASAKPSRPKKAKAKRASPDIPPEERRQSSRRKRVSTYTERDSSEDDEEMLDGVAEWEYLEKKKGGRASESASELSEAPSEESGEE